MSYRQNNVCRNAADVMQAITYQNAIRIVFQPALATLLQVFHYSRLRDRWWRLRKIRRTKPSDLGICSVCAGTQKGTRTLLSLALALGSGCVHVQVQLDARRLRTCILCSTASCNAHS